MRFIFFLFINLFKFSINYACLSSPTLEPVIVPKSTISTTTATQTTTCVIRVKKDTGLAETVCPTTTISGETTTSIGETTTTGIGETTTGTTTTTTSTITTTTTTTPLIPCVPPTGSSGLRISAADFALNNDATFGANIPVTGSCPCGSAIEVFSPGQAALDPTNPPASFAIILCDYPACNTPPCPMQCACTSSGACFIFAEDLPTNNFQNIVRYYPLNDGTFYAYVDGSLAATQIYDDQTMMPVNPSLTPFQVVAVGCGGCPALRASMASTCTATGPFTAAAG